MLFRWSSDRQARWVSKVITSRGLHYVQQRRSWESSAPDLLFPLGEYGKVPAEMESVRVLKMQILEAIAYPPLSSLRSRFCDAGELRKMQTASSD